MAEAREAVRRAPERESGDARAKLVAEASVLREVKRWADAYDVLGSAARRFTDDAEVRSLNAQYRHKDTPTNVLSFPMVQPDLLETLANSDDGEALLGDIVLARETCAREARPKPSSTESDMATTSGPREDLRFMDMMWVIPGFSDRAPPGGGT